MRTKTAHIILTPEGVIRVTIDRDARQDLDCAKENLAAAIAAGQGRKRPLLTDIRFCLPLTPEARRHYSGEVLVENFTSLGMLIASGPFGRIMGNVYIQIARPAIPTKLFTVEQDALRWLEEFVHA